MANPLFDRGIVPAPRPKHEDAAGPVLSDGLKSDIRFFAKEGEVAEESIALRIPKDADVLRFTNKVTSFCNTVGGPGWAKVRNQLDGNLRLWKKAQPDFSKLARSEA